MGGQRGKDSFYNNFFIHNFLPLAICEVPSWPFNGNFHARSLAVAQQTHVEQKKVAFRLEKSDVVVELDTFLWIHHLSDGASTIFMLRRPTSLVQFLS